MSCRETTRLAKRRRPCKRFRVLRPPSVIRRLALAWLLCFGAVPRLPAASGPYSSAPAVSQGGVLPTSRRKIESALAEAETAWRLLADPRASGPEFDEAQRRYAAATGRVIAGLNGLATSSQPDNSAAWSWFVPRPAIQVGAYRVKLANRDANPAAWVTGIFDEVWSVEKPAQNPAVPQALRAGVGAPLLGVRHGTAEHRAQDPGLPRRGYYLPATAILDFGKAPGVGTAPRDVRLEILDPREAAMVAVGSRRLPLAADFATPARQEVGVRNFGYLSLLGFLRPERALEYSGLFQFGPFRTDKIPVVFVHGLNSDPSIWENSTAALMADPELGRRCQFWYFFYPTGSAVTASSARLREALDRQRRFYDAKGALPAMDRLILVGHSMGGLLSHLQVVEPGNTLYDAYFAVPPERLSVPETFRWELRRDLFFHARRDVSRVVFICTPHRGSHLADWGIVRLLSRLVAVPKRLLDVSTQILTLNTDLLSPEMRRSGIRGLSSIDSLSPRNPYYPALEKLPIRRPFDTILGDRGRGDTPHSSDGVVGYWSAHWDGARSETIVPYGHQCTMKAGVCERLHEIVRGEILGKAKRPAHPDLRR